MADLYEALRPARSDPTADWLGRLGVYSPPHTWGAVKIWLKFPANDLEFWLYALNHHRESGDVTRGYGRDIPDFMKHVSDLAPLAGKLKRMNRAREIDDWRDFFTGNRTVIAVSGSGSQRPESELRLCLKPEFSALEIRRPGAAGCPCLPR